MITQNNWNTFEELEQKGKQLIEKAENLNWVYIWIISHLLIIKYFGGFFLSFLAFQTQLDKG